MNSTHKVAGSSPAEGAIKKAIADLIGKYELKNTYSEARVNYTSYIDYEKRRVSYFEFELDGMPVLPFFVELAEACKVPLADIRTDIDWGGGGCDTCGYGGEGHVTVRVLV